MIDSHIHLDDDRFNLNRVELISQAMDAGVADFIVPAVHVESFHRIKKLSIQYPQIKAAFGLHPYFIAQHQPMDLETLDKCLSSEPAIALGECGLDFYLKNLDKTEQYYYFDAQIELAKKHQLALILHVRGAINAVFEQLKKHHYFKAVMHSYNGSLQQTKLIVNQGIYCGFGTAVVNPKAHKLHELVRFVPLDSIMLETDAPDQPIYHRHGKINRPVDLLQVYKTVAELKKISIEQLITTTKANCQNLFEL